MFFKGGEEEKGDQELQHGGSQLLSWLLWFVGLAEGGDLGMALCLALCLLCLT